MQYTAVQSVTLICSKCDCFEAAAGGSPIFSVSAAAQFSDLQEGFKDTQPGELVLLGPQPHTFGAKTAACVRARHLAAACRVLLGPVLHTEHCTLHIVHYNLYTADNTLQYLHCTMQTSHWLLDDSDCILQTAHCTLYFEASYATSSESTG